LSPGEIICFKKGGWALTEKNYPEQAEKQIKNYDEILSRKGKQPVFFLFPALPAFLSSLFSSPQKLIAQGKFDVKRKK